MLGGGRNHSTPGGYSTGGRRKRRICGAEVADRIASEVPTRSRPRFQYQPNDDLYAHPPSVPFSGDESEVDENIPLSGSSNYNTFRDQCHQPRSTEACCGSSSNLVSMIQKQQQLLQEMLDAQKKIQDKQEEFESKLSELMKASEESTTTPDSHKKKFRIRRDLTVSIQ